MNEKNQHEDKEKSFEAFHTEHLRARDCIVEVECYLRIHTHSKCLFFSAETETSNPHTFPKHVCSREKRIKNERKKESLKTNICDILEVIFT